MSHCDMMLKYGETFSGTNIRVKNKIIILIDNSFIYTYLYFLLYNAYLYKCIHKYYDRIAMALCTMRIMRILYYAFVQKVDFCTFFPLKIVGNMCYTLSICTIMMYKLFSVLILIVLTNVEYYTYYVH